MLSKGDMCEDHKTIYLIQIASKKEENNIVKFIS